MSTLLPELKSGDVLVTASGRKVIVQRIRRPRRDTGLDEPLYRLVHILSNGRQQTGHAEWTREEIQATGCRMA